MDTGAARRSARGYQELDHQDRYAVRSPNVLQAGSILNHEDNLEKPSLQSLCYLKGRILSTYSQQDFETGWFFQRFVNLAMQLLSSREWYATDVEGGRIEQDIPGSLIVAIFSLLSPFVFPVVFAIAVVAVVPASMYALTLTAKKFPDNDDYSSDDISGALETEEKRYKWQNMITTGLSCVWYLLISVFPWVYYSIGPYQCAVNPSCADMKYHISPVTVWILCACCTAAGFRFVRAISTSACDCACDSQMKRMLRNPRYGKPLFEIIQKLSDMKDRKSFFPVFVFGENDEPEYMALSKKIQFSFILAGIVQALIPLLWMTYLYRQPLISFEVDYMTLMAVFLGSVAPCVEFRHFLYTFHNSIEEFQDVVDELLILTYIASPLKGKSRKMLKTRFEAAVRENDKYRLKRVEELRTADNGFECMDDPETERNFPRGHDHVDVEEIACQDEMIHLDVHQVAFNFRRVDGILLYKHMRKWLNTDILNERLEVELFLNISLQLIVAGILAIVYMFYKHQGINCIILLVPFNIVVLVFFILRALGLCILANEYLSEETEILLLSWQEQCAQWNNPDSIFEVKGRAPAVAWIWDTKQGREQPVTFPELDTEPGGDVAQSKEIYRLLQVLSKHCQVMEDKQCIWGLPVTRHLRNRLLASLGSVFAAFLVKAPTLLGQMKRLVHDVHVD